MNLYYLLFLPLLPTSTALYLPNPPYALAAKSDIASTTTNHADTVVTTPDTSSSSSTLSTANPPTTIPLPPSKYDLDRVTLPALKSTLRTCDVVFAVVALVLLIPGLAVAFLSGWGYWRNASDGENYEEAERLLRRESCGKGDVGRDGKEKQMEKNGRENESGEEMRDRKVMVEEEVV